MPKKVKQKCKREDGKRSDTEYAHNPRYCMILPDPAKPEEEDVSSTGQS